MSARNRILNRIRRAAEESGQTMRGENALSQLAERRATAAPRPRQSRLAGAEKVNQFIAKAEKAAATVTRITRIADLPEAVSHELRHRNLGQSVRMGTDPVLASLAWGQVEVSSGAGRIEEPATVSLAPYALAETGTLALTSGPDNPVTLTFLGETHFVAVRSSDILPGFEELWTAHRDGDTDPRTINFVTGPSRSGDIGQTLLLGAHGPVALHIFVVDDEAG
jgi:L-lactate dehydrogenase complex protein LldG